MQRDLPMLYRVFHAAVLSPGMTEAHELLAHTLRDMGSVEEAIQRYKDIIAQRST